MVQAAPTIDALRGRREAILAAARRRRASRVRVFGSVARGDAGPSSDVDLLVDFGAEASLLDQIGLSQDLETLLGVPVDVISTGGLRPRHRRIRDEAIDL
ncbi:MAG: nucleotidyltransferase domain-containing protein [Actinomycetota bacterium]|nr:nucleotidyltransferase domain-containing protein [Actinomycetota bacterium]